MCKICFISAQNPERVTNMNNILFKSGIRKYTCFSAAFIVLVFKTIYLFFQIQSITSTLNQIQANISGDDNTSGTVSGSFKIQLQHVFELIKKLYSTVSSGSTSGVSSLLQTILAQFKSLQSIAPSSVSQLVIQIISKITQLQQQIQTGKVNINSFKTIIQVVITPYMQG